MYCTIFRPTMTTPLAKNIYITKQEEKLRDLFLKVNVAYTFIPFMFRIRNRAFFPILDLCLNYLSDVYFANFYLGEFKREIEG